MNGREIKKLIFLAGLKPTEFCTEAGISIPTYYKFLNDQKVNDQSIWKIEAAISRLKPRKHPARRKEAVE